MSSPPRISDSRTRKPASASCQAASEPASPPPTTWMSKVISRAVSLQSPRYPAVMRIFTIGYEGATMDEFLAVLKAAGVERLIDVRALPLSRRPGFSKSPLRAALEQAGIEYVHLKALGTPAEGRAAARAGRHKDLERIYAGQLELAEAIAQSAQMLDIVCRLLLDKKNAQ